MSHWFSGSWSDTQIHLSIAYKELFPIVIAASLWGHLWVSRQVEFRSDNTSVVEVLRTGTSRDQHLMVLLWYLLLMAARHSFTFTASHVPGKLNPLRKDRNLKASYVSVPSIWIFILRSEGEHPSAL
jgi:hypothetical protein